MIEYPTTLSAFCRSGGKTKNDVMVHPGLMYRKDCRSGISTNHESEFPLRYSKLEKKMRGGVEPTVDGGASIFEGTRNV